MANFTPKKIVLSEINSGRQVENGDIAKPEYFNAPIEASAYAQQVADDAKTTAQHALDSVNETIGGEVKLSAYPVGSLYISSSPTDPALLFGGTWEQIVDKTIVGAGGKYAVDDTGGNENIILSANQLPLHTHPVSSTMETANVYASNTLEEATSNTGNLTTVLSYTAGYRKLPENQQGKIVADDVWGANRGESIDIRNPFIAKYMWLRIA